MTDNIVEAVFAGRRSARTRAVYQYDYGMMLKPIGLDLPSTYEVHFGTSATSPTVTQLGTADCVTIPDAMLTTGASVYAYIYLHSGEDDGETVYSIVIPVIARGSITDEQPTPVEQGIIEQAIAALNAGVETVQEIAEGIPEQIDTALAEAKASGEFDGADGVSPTVTVTPIIGGHQVMITDAEGEHTFDVTDGEDGLNGDPGADGFSPIATVTQTQTGAVISVTDKTGTTTATVANGAKGDPGNPGTPGADGFSPVATVTQTQTGATISITDKTGTTTAQISNGAKGDPGDDYVLTAQDKSDIAQLAAAEVDVPVTDVQVNGVSVLTDGVANVPIANGSTLGTIKVGSGLTINSSGVVSINKAIDTNIKAGTSQYLPIVPVKQDVSVFYGLAKAAGADMASSSNPVGTYTDAAKVAIQKMLGIYEAPWELIREDTFTNATSENYVISVDGNGQAFELTDVVLQIIIPSGETVLTTYGVVRLYYSSSAFVGAEIGALSSAGSTDKYAGVYFRTEKNGSFFSYSKYASSGTTRPVNVRNGDDFLTGNVAINQIEFRAIQGKVNYKLYGKRKWN